MWIHVDFGWVQHISETAARALCALLSPFKLPAIKDDSPLLNLYGVCYLEKKLEGKGPPVSVTSTDGLVETSILGAPAFSTFLWMNWFFPPTEMSYPCILTLSYIFGHLLQVHLCGFSIFDKTSSYMQINWMTIGKSPSMHLKFEWIIKLRYIYLSGALRCLPAYNLFIRKLWSIHKS